MLRAQPRSSTTEQSSRSAHGLNSNHSGPRPLPCSTSPDSTLLPGLINCHVGGRAPRPRGRRKEPAPDHTRTCPSRAGCLRAGAGRHPAGGWSGAAWMSPSVGATGHRLPPPVPGLGRRRDQARGYGPGGRWPGRTTQPSSGSPRRNHGLPSATMTATSAARVASTASRVRSGTSTPASASTAARHRRLAAGCLAFPAGGRRPARATAAPWGNTSSAVLADVAPRRRSFSCAAGQVAGRFDHPIRRVARPRPRPRALSLLRKRSTTAATP